jgi:hypothetical protein
MPKLSLRIAKKSLSSGKSEIKSTIVIQQPYAHLEKELRTVFKGQEDVEVILDRRYGERRERRKAVTVDHRKSNRRSPKEELAELVIST